MFWLLWPYKLQILTSLSLLKHTIKAVNHLYMFNKPSLKSEHCWRRRSRKDMNSSLLTPSSSSSSPHHLQSPATFDHDDFLQNFFSSAPWPSSVLEDDAPAPTSETAVASFHHHDVDSRNQITMIPLSHHNPNDAVDVNALYSGFSAGSLPFHFPQGSGGGVMKQSHTPTQSQATASTTTGGTATTPQTKPKVRARRGQATDPHSIAERVRFFFFYFSSLFVFSYQENCM